MNWDDPFAAKMLALLVTRVMLLAGAVLVWRRAFIVFRFGMVVGAAMLVASGAYVAGLCLRVIPGASWFSEISHIVDVGGWVCFAIGFLGFALTKRMKSQNKQMQNIGTNAPNSDS